MGRKKLTPIDKEVNSMIREMGRFIDSGLVNFVTTETVTPIFKRDKTPLMTMTFKALEVIMEEYKKQQDAKLLEQIMSLKKE